MKSTFILLAVAISFLPGCAGMLATSYGPRGLAGGYSEAPMGPGLWRLLYLGNQHLGSIGTERAFMRRSAELCSKDGYGYFLVEEGRSERVGRSVTMGSGSGTASPQLDGSMKLSYSPADSVRVSSYRKEGLVRCLKEDSSNPGSYDSEWFLKEHKEAK